MRKEEERRREEKNIEEGSQGEAERSVSMHSGALVSPSLCLARAVTSSVSQ